MDGKIRSGPQAPRRAGTVRVSVCFTGRAKARVRVGTGYLRTGRQARAAITRVFQDPG